MASDLRSAVIYDRHELRVGGRGFEGAQHRHGVDLGEVVEVPLVEHRSGHSLNSILLTFQNQGSVQKVCNIKHTIKVCVSCC